jgi:AraC-like DNA-binding protein
MVCDRCKALVVDALNKTGISFDKVTLGEVHLLQKMSHSQFIQLETLLRKSGLELLDNRQNLLVEKLLNIIDDLVDFPENMLNKINNEYLCSGHFKTFGSLNLLFSEIECVSIEKYIDEHKISKIKEMLSYNELSIIQIAEIMHYESVARLYRHFKSCTGLNPSYLKELRSHSEYHHNYN